MNFFDELEWRNMLHDATPGTREALESGTMTGYIGFDPTARSLTIGNYVQIMLLTLYQRSGHNPIILMGGATGRIGDPSGKDKERQLKSYEELDANLERQILQMKKFISFEGPNAARIVNNHDFYKSMNVLDFLRDVGKTLTVSYMMSKDSVKNRMETGLSFTEFSYQLLQAYDFQCLYEKYGCTMQMGGSDQWGNITSGTEFIRRNTDGKAYAATTPLLTKSDGKKFGKTESGNIWMDPEMTSPFKFYQFWINADDADTHKFTRYFTLHSREEIEAREKEYANDPRKLKSLLAEELTIRIHSEEAYQSVLQVSEILYNKNASTEYIRGLSKEALETIQSEIPSFDLSLSDLSNGIEIVPLLTEHTKVLSSKGEAKRSIKNNAIGVNKEKVASEDFQVTTEHLIQDKYILLENGRKNKFLLSFS
ncbi:MAG: tyrosine--tRNA ligase [Saprospiraceae bacterium]|nr:tyrosine--tRNA ligase [Saprospiraceae bacterium]